MLTSETHDSSRDEARLSVRFQLLGPFLVLHRDKQIEVGGRTAQAVLITLLRNHNKRISTQEIISQTWGHKNPVDADSVSRYVTALRKAFAPMGLGISRGNPGYCLNVPDDAIDAVQFIDLLTQGQALHATDPEEALRRLTRALDLWRGPALAGIGLPGTRKFADHLERRRLDAEENRAELELDRGHADQVLGRLRDLTQRYPARAGLTAAHIRALYATDRTSEAQALCDHVERAAAGRDMDRRLTIAIRDVRAGRRPALPRPLSTVPFQLPADTRHFTGRAAELATLLAHSPNGENATPTAVIEGMAGIGKTALAVRVGHLLAEGFSDGVLFVNLHGFTPGADPTPPGNALAALLRRLGVPGQSIPPDLDGRVALYRTVLADRRVLIVLDNASDESQIRPLIPSSAGCLVLVTSRRRLAGLDDAIHIPLTTMPATDAVAFFRTIVAHRATGGDQHTIEDIVALCGHLPLAIRIAAARLCTSQAMTPTHLHTELTNELKDSKSLDRLTDGERAVDAALAVSYRHLTNEQQHAFRLIGLHPGTHLDTHALAALADTTLDHAQQLLDDLERASLIDQPAYHHYTLNDLVRIYATYTANVIPESDQHTALGRLFDHYIHSATVAMEVAYPYEADQLPRCGEPPCVAIPNFDTSTAAQVWLDSELDNLLATADHGQPHHTLHMSSALRHHLYTRGHCTDALTLHTDALAIARDTGSRTGELASLHGLGHIHDMQGSYEQAADCFGQALEIARDTDNRIGELAALHGLGLVHWMQGRHDQAADCFGQTLAIARDTDNRNGELAALHGLGHVHWVQGRHERAADCFWQALAIARDNGNRTGELNALNGLGLVHWVQGRHGRAADCFGQALAIARNTSNPNGEVTALTGLGHVHFVQGRYEEAAECDGQALAIARNTSNRTGELNALNGLGLVHWVQGRHDQAADCFGQALAIARTTGNPNGEPAALTGLGLVHFVQGRYEEAAECHEQALAIARHLDNRKWQFEAHQGIARVRHATGHHNQALTEHHIALELATEPAQPQDQVRAHDGLARIHLVLAHGDQARHHWQAALKLLTTHSITRTDDPQVTLESIRARLAALDQKED